MNRKIIFSAVASVMFSAAYAGSASASFVVEGTPAWTRPTTAAQAASSLTTYQAWDGFDTTQSPSYQFPPNDPNSINPNGTPAAFDNAAPGDGAFFVGSDIYSFSDVIKPEVIVPGYSIPGNQLNVTAQVQYYGGDIDLNDLLVTYTDNSSIQHTVQADTLANFNYTQLFSAQSDVGFGEADQADYLWTFTVPTDSAIQLNWGWDAVSSAFQDVAVDTQSVPVPEPASMCIGVIGLSALLVTRRRGSAASAKMPH